MKKVVWLLTVFLLLAVVPTTMAQDPRDLRGDSNPPPPPPASPTVVKVGFFIRQIPSIDQISEDFTVEAFMDWQWVDERLAFDAEEIGSDEAVFINEEVVALLFDNALWWPELEITNERGSRDVEERTLTIHSDGHVSYQERISVKIQADFKLRLFPFDNQDFHIRIESFIYEHEDVVLEADERVIGFGDNLGEEEWVLQRIEPDVAERTDIRSEDGETFSELTLTLHIDRQIGFYLYRIILPLILIIGIFCATFWLNDYDTQLAASTTGLLTLVAFEFAISDSLPNLAYLTLMEAILMYSFTTAAIAVVINLALMRWHKSGQDDRANRVNRMAAIALPVWYIAGFGVLWVVFNNL